MTRISMIKDFKDNLDEKQTNKQKTLITEAGVGLVWKTLILGRAVPNNRIPELNVLVKFGFHDAWSYKGKFIRQVTYLDALTMVFELTLKGLVIIFLVMKTR